MVTYFTLTRIGKIALKITTLATTMPRGSIFGMWHHHMVFFKNMCKSCPKGWNWFNPAGLMAYVDKMHLNLNLHVPEIRYLQWISDDWYLVFCVVIIVLFHFQILKYEWPRSWPSFIGDIVGASKTNESLCQNNMTILKLLR
jgi:hypothetical protein